MSLSFSVSEGSRVLNTWLCRSPDSALLTIRGMWQPTQLAKEWMEWAMFWLTWTWHWKHCLEPAAWVWERVGGTPI